jgi:hypothetical protein
MGNITLGLSKEAALAAAAAAAGILAPKLQKIKGRKCIR